MRADVRMMSDTLYAFMRLVDACLGTAAGQPAALKVSHGSHDLLVRSLVGSFVPNRETINREAPSSRDTHSPAGDDVPFREAPPRGSLICHSLLQRAPSDDGATLVFGVDSRLDALLMERFNSDDLINR